MYKRILVAIEHSAADRSILDHVARLAALTGAELLLVHVADGFAARHFDELKLRESEEVIKDREYLERITADLRALGLTACCELAKGDPATELVRVAEGRGADLVAMATHGHKFIADIIKGATADRVRHNLRVPVLLLRAQ
jgi:nucleotide-binding universal stress UspA family protein